MRLHLTQERIDLHAELVRITNGPEADLSSYEKDFIRVARNYGDLAGVTYAAWRQVGVDAEVLEQAGIQRTAPTRPDASRVRRAPDAVPEGDSAPLLPRTEPIPEPAAADAVEAVAAPAPAAVAPELALEPPSPEPSVVDAPAPAPAPASKPAPAKARPAKKSRPAQKPAAPKAVPDAAESTPPHGDQVGPDDEPKLRRKRIAD